MCAQHAQGPGTPNGPPRLVAAPPSARLAAVDMQSSPISALSSRAAVCAPRRVRPPPPRAAPSSPWHPARAVVSPRTGRAAPHTPSPSARACCAARAPAAALPARTAAAPVLTVQPHAYTHAVPSRTPLPRPRAEPQSPYAATSYRRHAPRKAAVVAGRAELALAEPRATPSLRPQIARATPSSPVQSPVPPLPRAARARPPPSRSAPSHA